MKVSVIGECIVYTMETVCTVLNHKIITSCTPLSADQGVLVREVSMIHCMQSTCVMSELSRARASSDLMVSLN